ncbi:MAG: hypothetical protein FWG40_12780, partial [Peptococcaceae bacterium]|nr:hypothetical protein [Peptococcaceae bacterium]
DNEITDLFSFSSLIEELPIEPYITPKGGYIDDKAIRACKEARKARGAKDKAASDEGQGENG